ncbi:MAG: PDZ domain-containing protein [Thalassotalea sp.]|nr:PDZ domain-containing protein [Thalassotalea sp.]
MNLVFKIIVFSVLLLSQQVSADETLQCSIFSINQNDEYILKIIAVDGQPLVEKASYRQIIDSRVTYQITPGEHTLTLRQYPKSYFQLMQSHFAPRASAKGAKDIKVKVIHLNVEPNYSFQIEMIDNSENSALHVNSFEPQVCKSVDEDNFIGEKSTIIVDKEPLPNLLEEKLNSLRTRLYQFHQHTLTNEANIIPIKVDEYFGSIIDDKYSQNNRIKVLSVLPFSIASSLGFKSGDDITHMGNEPINPDLGTSRELFENYIQTVKNNDLLIFTIARANKIKILEGKKRLIIIPNSYYHFKESNLKRLQITNNKKMDEQTTFDYERQIIALYEYYKSKGLVADQVKIYRNETESSNLGIQGKAIQDVGLLISSVKSMSPMDKIGLKASDIIVKATNKTLITDSAAALTSQTQQWRNGQLISIDVKRDGQFLELTGIFEAEFIPAFSLTIDLKSHEYMTELQKKINTLKNGVWSPIYRQLNGSQHSNQFSSIKSRAASNAADNRNKR